MIGAAMTARNVERCGYADDDANNNDRILIECCHGIEYFVHDVLEGLATGSQEIGE
jgi:hypothetical protein